MNHRGTRRARSDREARGSVGSKRGRRQRWEVHGIDRRRKYDDSATNTRNHSAGQSHGLESPDVLLGDSLEATGDGSASGDGGTVGNASSCDRHSSGSQQTQHFGQSSSLSAQTHTITAEEASENHVLDSENFPVVHVFIGKEAEQEREARRLGDVMSIIERGKLSEALAQELFMSQALQAKFSHASIIRHIERRAHVSKRFKLMCPGEHMVFHDSRDDGIKCPIPSCRSKASDSHRFWYRLISEQLRALCPERESFLQLYNGCVRAYDAMERPSDTMFDYYDGSLFRKLHGRRLQQWKGKSVLYVLLTFSSDGFEEFRTHAGVRSAWPTVFIILNLNTNHRFRSCNALFASFIPGTHTTENSDTFLRDIIDDLVLLQCGIEVLCADGVRRILKVFVLFVTADWPGASKLLGYKGHRASCPCRFCHKIATWDSSAKTVLLIPIMNIDAVGKDFIVGDPLQCDTRWIDAECPERRTDRKTRKVWAEIVSAKQDQQNGKRGSAKLVKEIETNSSIKNRPELARLAFDVVDSVPYDPMHLCFLGWVRHLIVLCTGTHAKCVHLESAFCIKQSILDSINASLEMGYKGIPAAWGRPPMSLMSLSNYRAEDFKSFGLFYGPVLFSVRGIPRKMKQLWAVTSEFLHIVCDPTPHRSDIQKLRLLVQRAHVLFTALFYVDKAHSFVFTPTTHAILHLWEMLDACGPLCNVSQFAVERIAGELGTFVKSMARPEANLFHKKHTLFCLRLAQGGLANKHADETLFPADADLDNHGDTGTDTLAQNAHLRGPPVTAYGDARRAQVVRYIRSDLPTYAHNLRLQRLDVFQRATIGERGVEFDIESKAYYMQREKRDGGKARQKHWIAAHFETGGSGEGYEVYYGSVDEIYRVEVSYRSATEQINVIKSYDLVCIEWQYGLELDMETRVPSVALTGRTRHVRKSLEDINCVCRSIAYFDHGSRRYFWDPERYKVVAAGCVKLGGLK